MALSSIPKLPPPRYGKLTTVLSVDGGGVRGIIPSILLSMLETQLQELEKNPDARLCDYFDVISGTSTGGLVAAMLTAPNEHGRPIFAAKDITNFYMHNCAKIFPHKSWLARKISIFNGPVYSGTPLHEIINQTVKTRLSQSLTNLVIPTFDIKTLKPVIFSSNEVKLKPYLDCKLSDICIGTTAAPTYLPAHQFTNEFQDTTDDTLKFHEFNLIDGGVLADNPTLVGMSFVKRAILNEDTYFMEIEPMDYERFLVISLGTGSSKIEEKYDAKMASKWGALGWLIYNFSNPLVEVFMQGSVDLVELHLAALFQALETADYLRIQDDALKKEEVSLDISTDDNLKNLVKIGVKLLTQTVMRLNLKTDDFEPDKSGITNGEELKRLAEKLVEERKLRINNKLQINNIQMEEDIEFTG